MRLRVCVPLAACALLAAMIVPGAAFAHGTHLKAKMSGDQIVGEEGALRGSGTANLHLLRKKGRVCFKVTYSDIGPRKGLSVGVYSGKKGENGNLLFLLFDADLKSPVKDCVNGIKKKQLKRITRKPRKYHVNVKSDKYSVDGAIRGQLRSKD